MRQSKPLTITLPQKMADEVKARVASGHYASESEVIREGLRALATQEEGYKRAFEDWLKTEGKERIADYKAGRSKSVPAKEAFAQIYAHIEKRDVEAKTKTDKAPVRRKTATRS